MIKKTIGAPIPNATFLPVDFNGRPVVGVRRRFFAHFGEMGNLVRIILATGVLVASMSVSFSQSNLPGARISAGSWTCYAAPIVLTISKGSPEGSSDRIMVSSRCNQREGQISYSKDGVRIAILNKTANPCQTDQSQAESLISRLADGKEHKIEVGSDGRWFRLDRDNNLYFSPGDKFGGFID
jgi:hypothetical protein